MVFKFADVDNGGDSLIVDDSYAAAGGKFLLSNTILLGGVFLGDDTVAGIILSVEGQGVFNLEKLSADEREEIRQKALKIRKQIKARKNK